MYACMYVCMCVVLRCGVLCCVVLYCAVLCCVLLCFVMLCFVWFCYCMYVCMHACMHVCVYLYIYILYIERERAGSENCTTGVSRKVIPMMGMVKTWIVFQSGMVINLSGLIYLLQPWFPLSHGPWTTYYGGWLRNPAPVDRW